MPYIEAAAKSLLIDAPGTIHHSQAIGRNSLTSQFRPEHTAVLGREIVDHGAAAGAQ